jgi:threonine aldolase
MDFVRKFDGQLASKMRFASAQLLALYDGDLWLRSARHANAMAARLAAGVAHIDGVRITQPEHVDAFVAALGEELAARVG